MKISISLLTQWLNITIPLPILIKQLTLLGFEVESIEACNVNYNYLNNNVLIGKIININYIYIKFYQKIVPIYIIKIHNNNLYNAIIENNVYFNKNLLLNKKIVLALNGTILNNNYLVNTLHLNNNIHGIICSYYHIGLSKHKNSKIIILNESEVQLGDPIKKYLDISDYIIKIYNPYYNRKDCQNILSIAKELIIYNYRNKLFNINNITKKIVKSQFNKINILKCSFFNFSYKISSIFSYFGIIIKNIDDFLTTPLWLYEKLYYLDIPISDNIIINFINFIFFNTGIFLNFIDLDNFNKIPRDLLNIHINQKNGLINYLYPREINLTNYSNIIPLYFEIDKTKIYKNILLESIIYNANYINKISKKQIYFPFLNIDYKLPIYAYNFFIKNLIKLNSNFLTISSIFTKNYQRNNFSKFVINFNISQIKKKIGIIIPIKDIIIILKNLNFKVILLINKCKIYINKIRLDINLPINLISEILRIYNYKHLQYNENHSNYINKIIKYDNTINIKYNETLLKLKQYLIYHGYYELINYSFINYKIQNVYFNHLKTIKLLNYVSKEMSGLRQSLLLGLLNSLIYNFKYNYKQIKLFEIGECFSLNTKNNNFDQYTNLAVIIYKNKYFNNWNNKNIDINFFSLKENVENLLEIIGIKNLDFKYQQYKFFDNNQSLKIIYHNKLIGYLGKLNSSLISSIKNLNEVFFFELLLSNIIKLPLTQNFKFKPIYLHPIIIRDISLVMLDNVNILGILQKLKSNLRKLLINISIFDIYRGNSIKQGYKNIGIRLELQNPQKNINLTENILHKLIYSNIKKLQQHYILTLRDQYFIK